jgi:hypothetical protein
VDPSGIPAELRARRQWVLWRFERRRGKITKVPYIPHKSSRNARSNDPSTWGDLENAWVRYRPRNPHPALTRWDGIGYEFSAADPYMLIDLDAGFDPDAGCPVPWAQAIVDATASYTELSPSGTGLHIIIRGTLPGKGRKIALPDQPAIRGKDAAVEVYDQLRYVALTGCRLPGTPDGIVDGQAALTALLSDLAARYGHAERQEGPQEGRPPRPTLDLLPSDRELVERAESAVNGPKFSRLWAGDTSMHGGDHSAADQALCNALAFWCGGDEGRMDRLFRQSGLMRPKWERADYREATITKAIRSCRTFYTGKKPGCQDGQLGGLASKSLTQIPPIPALGRVTLLREEEQSNTPQDTSPDPFQGGAYRRVLALESEASRWSCKMGDSVLLQNLEKATKAASLRVSCKQWRCHTCSRRLAGKWLRHLLGKCVERQRHLAEEAVKRGDQPDEHAPIVYLLDCPRQRLPAARKAIRKAGGQYAVIHASGIGSTSAVITTTALPGAKPVNLFQAGELIAGALEQIDSRDPPRKPVATSNPWKLPKAEKERKWRFIANAKGLDREAIIEALAAAGLGCYSWAELPEAVEWALSWLFPDSWTDEQVQAALARMAAGMPVGGC